MSAPAHHPSTKGLKLDHFAYPPSRAPEVLRAAVLNEIYEADAPEGMAVAYPVCGDSTTKVRKLREAAATKDGVVTKLEAAHAAYREAETAATTAEALVEQARLAWSADPITARLTDWVDAGDAADVCHQLADDAWRAVFNELAMAGI